MNTNFADIFSELGKSCKPKQNTKWHDLISYYLVHGVALDVKYNFFFSQQYASSVPTRGQEKAPHKYHLSYKANFLKNSFFPLNQEHFVNQQEKYSVLKNFGA